MSKYKAYDEQIKELNSEGKLNTDIAKEIGIDSRRIPERLKILGLKSNKRKFNDQPTEDEEKIFISMFMGDGAIYKSTGGVNYRVNLAHSPKQKDYFMMKYKRVKDFIGTEYFKETQFHNKYQKNYHCYKFQSKVNPYFTRMRDKWYKNGKKIIPDDVADFLDGELLAYKFFDDGNIKPSGYEISMNSHTKRSISNFRNAMFKNFDIETNLHAKGIVYIPSRERLKFRRIVEPYATQDVLYKLGEFSETPTK